MNPNELTVKHLEAKHARQRFKAYRKLAEIAARRIDAATEPVAAYRVTHQVALNQFNPPWSLDEIGSKAVVPACCSAGCVVEKHKRCQHGHPAVTVVLGLT